MECGVVNGSETWTVRKEEIGGCRYVDMGEGWRESDGWNSGQMKIYYKKVEENNP